MSEQQLTPIEQCQQCSTHALKQDDAWLLDNYIDLLAAIIRLAVKDAKSGDRDALEFLEHIGLTRL